MSQLPISFLDRQGQILELFSKRQQLLAGNIANADTPGFKARDVDFASALKAAQHEGLGPTTTMAQARHMPLTSLQGSGEVVQWRAAEQPSADGNTVDLDRERANFADNALRYEATLRFINGHVKTILTAITGQ